MIMWFLGVVDSVRKLNCDAHLEQKWKACASAEISYASRSNFTFIIIYSVSYKIYTVTIMYNILYKIIR